MEKELEEIAEFISIRINTLMPKLAKDYNDTELWGFLQAVGKYFVYYGAAIGGSELPEDAHSFALGKLLQDESVQNLIAKLLAQKIDKAAGV
jgi:hypothetical protein